MFNTLRLNATEIRSSRDVVSVFINEIKSRRLKPNQQIPPVNELSQIFDLNRLTIMKAMDELEIEGWIIKKERVGMKVAINPPVPDLINPRNYGSQNSIKKFKTTSIKETRPSNPIVCSFSDGSADVRLFPFTEYHRIHSKFVRKISQLSRPPKHNIQGDQALRESLSEYFLTTRNIISDSENILITRGAAMSFYLVFESLCKADDTVAITRPSYQPIRDYLNRKKIKRVEVNIRAGIMDLEEFEQRLRRTRIKLLFINSHSHYPTGYSISTDQRLHLLKLAQTYNFIIVEGDNDFEFDFKKRAISPIASLDHLNNVVYIGGFHNSLTSLIKLGYIFAETKLMNELVSHKFHIERRNDIVLESTLNDMFESGLVSRTVRKCRKIYESRAQHFEKMLNQKLSDVFHLDSFTGGLAFWVKINKSPNKIDEFVRKCKEKGLDIIHPNYYNSDSTQHTRLGYAHLSENELEKACELILSAI